MIWALLNLWWLVPALLALCVGVALLSGVGLPVLRELARRVPAPVWQALALAAVLSFASDWLIGVGEGRCRAAQAAAEDKADIKAAKVAGRTAEKVEADRANITKETSDAAAEVRTIVRTVRASCPADPVPERVHELGRAAVEAARRELPAEPGADP